MSYVYQLMDMRTINADGSMGHLTGKVQRHFYREIKVHSPLDLPQALEALFCETMDVNTSILFNSSMAPGGPEPEVRVHVGRVAGTGGSNPRDAGQVLVCTLVRVDR